MLTKIREYAPFNNMYLLFLSLMQTCLGLLVTLLLRSLSALWTQDIQDMVQLWTCERP